MLRDRSFITSKWERGPSGGGWEVQISYVIFFFWGGGSFNTPNFSENPGPPILWDVNKRSLPNNEAAPDLATSNSVPDPDLKIRGGGIIETLR